MKNQFDEILTEKIEKGVSKDFWLEYNIEYSKILYAKFFAYKNSLTDYYNLDNPGIISIIQQIEEDIYKMTFKDLEKKTKEISTFAVEYFKKLFLYDEAKLPRKWHRIQEDEIDDIFSKSKNKSEILLDILSQIKLIKAPIYKSKIIIISF